MLRQLAVKGNGLSCKECQVHGAAVSVGTGKGMEKRAAGLRSGRQAGSQMHPLTAGSYNPADLPGSAALSKAALPGFGTLLD